MRDCIYMGVRADMAPGIFILYHDSGIILDLTRKLPRVLANSLTQLDLHLEMRELGRRVWGPGGHAAGEGEHVLPVSAEAVGERGPQGPAQQPL